MPADLTPEQTKSIAEQVATEIMEKAKGQRDGLAALSAGQEPEQRSPVTGKDAADGKGIHFARAAKAMFVAKLTGREPVDVLKGWGYAGTANLVKDALDKQKAAVATGNRYESLGAFIGTQMSSEIFELLRPKVFVRQNARTVPLIGGLEFRKQTSTSTSAYSGESTAASQSEVPETGAAAMTERKLTTLVSFSNRLLQLASPSAEEFVRDDVLQSKARKENLSFYMGDGTKGTPKGIRNSVKAAHVLKESAAAINGAYKTTPTLAEVRKVRAALLKLLRKADAPMLNLRWAWNPQVTTYLEQVSDGNGNAVYEAQLGAGKFGAYGFDDSNQIPDALADGGTQNLTEIGVIDYSEVIIGQGDNFLEMFPNSAIEVGGNVRSGVNRDESVLRLIDYHDLIMRHDVSAAFCQVGWGY